MRVRFRRVDWEFARPFRTSQHVRTHAQTLQVELERGGFAGRGEALGVHYHGEHIDSLLEQVASIAVDLSGLTSRDELGQMLPPGGARNAIDCALWDLEAKGAGRRVFELAGIPSVHTLTTAYTIGIEDRPETMARVAAERRRNTVLKVKLSGDDDLARIASIREARADAIIIVDANQAWTQQHLYDLTPQLAALDVELIEQPLPVGADQALEQFESPVPICADESCQTTESLATLSRGYQYVNIKLDKTGGLTEALRLARSALECGFKLMVGCMGGSSLSMAPAFVVGQHCDIVDLDGPLLLRTDMPDAIEYDGDRMSPPRRKLWG